MHAELSSWRLVGNVCLSPSSDNSRRSHTTSFVARVAALYSASAVERASANTALQCSLPGDG